MPLTISIIPARNGSKRVPGKNLRSLRGVPLVGWSIQSSLRCSIIDRHLVSTDSEDIAEVALSLGAEVIMRPAELATDTASTVEVCRHVVRTLEEQGESIATIVLLQPTSPFRKDEDLNKGLQAVKDNQGDMALGITQVKAGPDWYLAETDGHLNFPFRNDFQRIRSQDQPTYYRPNGSFYIYQRQVLMQDGPYAWGERVVPLAMKPPFDLDIDYEHDFRTAEAIAHADFQNW